VQGWVDLCYVKADRLGFEPATCQSQVQRPTAAPICIRSLCLCHQAVAPLTMMMFCQLLSELYTIICVRITVHRLVLRLARHFRSIRNRLSRVLVTDCRTRHCPNNRRLQLGSRSLLHCPPLPASLLHTCRWFLTRSLPACYLRPSVRPSVCFHSIFCTDWPLTWVCVGV